MFLLLLTRFWPQTRVPFWENGLSKHICNKILRLKVVHSAGQQS